mgnify:CR=1 FL=1
MSALLLLSGASGFVLPSQPGLCRPGRPGTTAAAAASAPTVLTVLHPQAAPTRTAAALVQMGLFGLGYPEIAVIALVGVALLGPEKLIPMAKDLGSALPPSNPLHSLGPRVISLSCRRGASAAQPARVVLTPTLTLVAGKSAGGLKEVSDSFQQGMAEGEVGICADTYAPG